MTKEIRHSILAIAVFWGFCLFPVTIFAGNLKLMHDKGGSPNYQPFYEKVAIAAKSEVNVTFEPTPFPTTDVFQATICTSLPSKKAPGLFTWWSTYRIEPLIQKGLVEDLTPLWDKYRDDFPVGLRNAFSFNEKVYGFPTAVDYWAVFYNKDIFRKSYS